MVRTSHGHPGGRWTRDLNLPEAGSVPLHLALDSAQRMGCGGTGAPPEGEVNVPC